MNGLLTVLAVNASTAALLALAVAAVSRIVGRPSVTHALWLLVLVELLVPPVVEISVLPQVAAAGVARGPMGEVGAPSAAPFPALEAGAAAEPVPASWIGTLERPSRSTVAGTAWLLGVVAVLGLAGYRLLRFRRLVAGVANAPASLSRRLDRLARRMGLRRRPELRLVPGRLSPLLLHRPGRLELLIPEALLNRLGTSELDALLVHELAHVKRRDYWVRYVELAAQAVFWWHPLVWWARARLRRVEEQCCDGLVVRTLPGHSGDYARGLLKTVEFLAGHGSRLPALASGIGEVRHLEERLTMIVKQRQPDSLASWKKIVLALAAVALLLVFPTWAERAPGGDAERRDAEAEQTLRLGLLDLEREAVELEKQLQEVRTRQMELQLRLERERQDEMIAQMDLEIERLAATGRSEEADQLRREQQRMRGQIEIGAVQLRLEQERMRHSAELEFPLRHLTLELEEARERGEAERASELERRIAEQEHALQLAELRTLEEQQALENDVRRRELERRLIESERRDAADVHENAGRAERELAELRLQLESLGESVESAELKQLQQEYNVLEDLLRELGSDPGNERTQHEIQLRLTELKERLAIARTREY